MERKHNINININITCMAILSLDDGWPASEIVCLNLFLQRRCDNIKMDIKKDPGERQVAGSFKDGNEYWGSVKRKEFFD